MVASSLFEKSSEVISFNLEKKLVADTHAIIRPLVKGSDRLSMLGIRCTLLLCETHFAKQTEEVYALLDLQGLVLLVDT